MRLKKISYDKYDKLPYIRASDIRLMSQSMLAFKYHNDNINDKKTSSMLLGRALHCKILESEEYSNRYTTYNGIRRGKDYELFIKDNPYKEVLNEDETFKIDKMSESLLSLNSFPNWFDSEVTLLFTHNSFRCKSRLDMLYGPHLDDITTIADIKTCSSLDQFTMQVCKFGYILQSAFYQLATLKNGYNVNTFKFFVVENKPPFDATSFIVDQNDVENARDVIEELLEQYKTCCRTGIYPGRFKENENLNLSKWSYNNKETMDLDLDLFDEEI